LSLENIRALPGVEDVSRDRDAYEIRVTEAEPVLRQLFLLDARLAGVEVSSAGLEEAFLALTQNDNGNSKPENSGR